MASSHVGIVVTLAGALGLATATLARRLVERYPTMWLACLATVALGTIWMIPVADQGMVAIACFLAAGASARMLLNPASYVLVGEGAIATGSGTAVTVGASNAIFGVAGMIGPLVGAMALPHPELGFVAIALSCLLAGALMRNHARQVPSVAGIAARRGQHAGAEEQDPDDRGDDADRDDQEALLVDRPVAGDDHDPQGESNRWDRHRGDVPEDDEPARAVAQDAGRCDLLIQMPLRGS
jgi:hypothetical protein